MNSSRTLMTGLSLILLTIGVDTPAEMRTATAGERVLIDSETSASTEFVEIALDRFAKASLLPPVIEFHFNSDRSGCKGNRGLHGIEGGVHRIDLCARGRSDNLILHEIAHAWVGENISIEQRIEFLGMRGLDVWTNAHTPWRERGTEHAASVLAWGLGERCSAAPGLLSYDPVSMVEAFVFLSGTQPLCETAVNDPGRPREASSDRRGGVVM